MTATYAKFTLQLNTVTDADVIEYLKAQANKNDTIRRALHLLRAWEKGQLPALMIEKRSGKATVLTREEREDLTSDEIKVYPDGTMRF